jgi:hypothetical protein
LDHFGINTQGDALGLLGSHRWRWEEMGCFFGSHRWCWEEMGCFFGSHRWCWEEMGCFFDDLALGGEAADFLLVAGKSEAFVKGAGDLALEFADGPLVGGGFDLVEAAFVGGIDGKEFDVMGPAEGQT